MTKIFLTGASGFIGGEALHKLYHTSRERPTIRVLLRDQSKKESILKQYPDVSFVESDLDDAKTIEEEAAEADQVFHLASTSHVASAEAVARGLSRSSRTTPGYWIQMSGASMFSGPDMQEGKWGEARNDIYDDVADAGEIRSIIANNPKRVVDNLVLSMDPSKVRTALIIGPLIYGTGQGPVNQRSIQLPTTVRHMLKTGRGFRIGAGLSRWSNIHIRDLGSILVTLHEAAVDGKGGLWNQDGIYGVENGSMAFGELGERVAREAYSQGLIASPTDIEEIDPADADVVMPHAAVLLATNALTKCSRLKQRLGWVPTQQSLQDTIADVVRDEADDVKHPV